MKQLLERCIDECKPYTEGGRVANYIPELAKADKSRLGIAAMTADRHDASGDADVKFTMQSVVKPMILLLALMDCGREKVESLVGVEATGKPFDAFNYSDRALTGEHINPMINAGAIALCTLVSGADSREKFTRLLALTRKMAANDTLEVDEAVYLSESATGSKNRALAYMLKAYGMIDCEIEPILEMYFKACSISVTAKDLARIAYVLSRHGVDEKGVRIVDEDHARYVNAILAICGMYDGSGEFALRVGVPAKSGVGGGIMAVVPGKMGIGIYSPSLDKKGNSIAGVKALELLSRELGLSIF